MAKSSGRQRSLRDQWHAGAPLDASHRFLQAHGAALSGLRPITYRQYVQRGLDLANWDGHGADRYHQLTERLLVGGDWEPGTRVLDLPPASSADLSAGHFYRDLMFREISAVLGKPPRQREREIEPGVRTPLDVPPTISSKDLSNSAGRRSIIDLNSRSRHGQVVSIGVAWEENGRTSFGSVMRPANLHAAIDTVMWLLISEEEPFGNELRQCKWERCYNLFLAEKPKAGPRRSYCPYGNCMEEAHRAGTRDRKDAVKLGVFAPDYRDKKNAEAAGMNVNAYRKMKGIKTRRKPAAGAKK